MAPITNDQNAHQPLGAPCINVLTHLKRRLHRVRHLGHQRLQAAELVRNDVQTMCRTAWELESFLPYLPMRCSAVEPIYHSTRSRVQRTPQTPPSTLQ